MIIIEKQAYWINDGNGLWCSNCGKEALYTPTDSWADDIEYVPSEYCPHCGAKMDEEV